MSPTTLSTITKRLLTSAQLDALRPSEWLIGDVMPVGGFTVMFGSPGSFKTFVALDWALSVATGARWAGRAVKRGPVLYIAAEGVAGLSMQKRAWQEKHGYEDLGESIHFLPDPVNLLDEDPVLPRIVQRLRPALVVVDTMARCMVGGDENSAKDVGVAVHVTGQLCRMDAEVVFIHHSNKGGNNYRGSSAPRGALPTR